MMTICEVGGTGHVVLVIFSMKTIEQEIKGDVCSTMVKIIFDENTQTIEDMFVLGGCHGQNQIFRRLVHGRTLEEIVKIFSGITCGRKGTSCPNEIAQIIKKELGL